MSKPVKILVVEDSEDDTRLAMLTLRRGGFNPTFERVEDKSALMGALHREYWDAVISDYRLPGFSGVEALRIVRASGLDVPFIFFSGTIGEETAVEAMKAGASDYVMKQNLARLAPVLERELVQAAIRAEHRQGRIELEVSRDRYEAKLREVQKMESIGTLAGGIAHDFNNILGAILGNVTLAREEVGPGHPALGSLEEIQKASLRARNLVQQILAFSRRVPPELNNLPLHAIVEETRKLLRATLPAGVELQVTASDPGLHVHADATQLQQVLMNLCTNAWQAMQQGPGRIEIGLALVTVMSGTAEHPAGLAPGNYAHVWVSDTGKGMDQLTRERIFEPFFTTKPVGQGTGLGLSVVHGIVTAHHGAITVDSEPGRGSTFHLYFPAVAAPPATPQPEAPLPAARSGQGQHVVYVDDDEPMLLMVERILEKAGYRVTPCSDPHHAIAIVRDQPDAFDVVVTDYNMPGCSGLDVARAVMRSCPNLPVIISSGYITEDLRVQARRHGVRALLEKQNTFQELGALVSRVLGEEPAMAPPGPAPAGP